MTPDANEVTTTAAVLLGAVALVAAPVTIIVSRVLVTGLETAGLHSATGWSDAVLAVSGVVGLQFAAEAAAIRLNGLSALRRGRSVATVVRDLAITTGTVVVLGLATWYGLTLVVGRPTWYAAILGAVAALAAFLSVSRFSSPFGGLSRSNSG